MKNNETFEVLVQPNIDYAFIVALLMIVGRMKYFDDDFSVVTADAVTESVCVLFIGICLH